MKRLARVLFSVQAAIILMAVIALYAVALTLLPPVQDGQPPPRWAQIAGLYPAYSSTLFLLLLGLFFVNLLGCTLQSAGGRLRQFCAKQLPAAAGAGDEVPLQPGDAALWQTLLAKKHYRIWLNEQGFCAQRDRIGLLGPTITHLGILLLLVAGIIGALSAKTGVLTLAPGDRQTLPFNGSTAIMKRFAVEYRPDGSVAQYRTFLDIQKSGQLQPVQISVNHPYQDGTFQLYAMSYGWLNHLLIEDSQGQALHRADLGNQSSTLYEPALLSVFLYGYYPDFAKDETGEPYTRSEQPSNPKYVLALYSRDQRLGAYTLGPGEAVVLGPLRIGFTGSDMYSVLGYRRDISYPFMLAACALLLAGLFVAFFLYPKIVCVRQDTIAFQARQHSRALCFQLTNAFAHFKEARHGQH